MPRIVSLLTHVLATAWGTFQVFSTSSFQESFNRLTTDGACGVNLIPTYWKARAAGEIPSVVLNAVALLLSAFLSWRLIKVSLKLFKEFKKINKLVLTIYSAIWMADVQACWSLSHDQPCLQARLIIVYRYSAILLLHCCFYRSVD